MKKVRNVKKQKNGQTKSEKLYFSNLYYRLSNSKGTFLLNDIQYLKKEEKGPESN